MDLTQDTPPSSDPYPMELGPEGQFGEPPPVDAETMGFAPETIDLTATLSDVDQQKLADDVFRAYERDWKGSEKFRERRTSIIKLFLGMLPQSEDEDGSYATAQIHYPIIATAVQRMHARIYDQQFPASGEFFGVKPLDAMDMDRALRVAKHLNWQVMHKIPEYVMNHDVLIMQWLLYGSAFSYLYWDPVKDRPCHEVCRTEDIVLPYTFHSTDPSMGDVPRITRVLRKYRYEMEDMAEVGYYTNIDLLDEKERQGGSSSNAGNAGFMADVSSTGGQSMREVTDKAQGIEKPGDEKEGPSGDGPRVLLEQHRWWKLPGERKQRPIVATVDKETKVLLSVRLREDEDPQDRARYNREKAANRASYEAAMMQYQMDMSVYMTGAPAGMGGPPPMGDATQPPMPGEQTTTQPPMPGEMTPSMPGLNPMMPPPPQPPLPPEEPEPPKMVPINFFTHYVCIPNPEGILGFGIGFMLEGHNIVADTLASQVLDAASLANGASFFYSRQAKLKRGELRFKPGEGVETDLSPQDLDKGIKMIQFPGPDPTLGNMIREQKEEAEAFSGANEILSGEVGGSNETATTTQIRVQQALAGLQILNKRYTRARSFEGQKLARLNSVHLTDKEYFTVVDPFKTVPASLGGMPQAPQPGMVPNAPGGPQQMPPASPPPPGGPGLADGAPGGQALQVPGAPIGGPQPPMGPPPPQAPPMMGPPPPPIIEEHFVARIDYLEDVDITITADPRMASQVQRVQEAQMVMNLINGNPLTAQMPPLVMAGMKMAFTAIDRPEMVAALEQGAMFMAMQPPQPPQGGGGAPGAAGGPPKPQSDNEAPGGESQ